ncbi:class I SAM-dependent methyltransferase [Nocardioides nanhaiensis]|uniref:class I SAM-dependent methyltransferase n=1 Tax=Nocardioides nanhaiensis TaxID=1476871 RepID=UPI0031E6C88D
MAGLAVSNPQEFADRVQGRIERRRHRSETAPPLFSDPQGWGDALHRLLGEPEQCRNCDRFSEIWADIEADLPPDSPALGEGFDAGVGLAQAAYVTVRHLKPARVVETGVARGVTTRFVLEAMAENGHGQLTSIDLPPLTRHWHQHTASAVPQRLHHRWQFVRGSSRRELPYLLAGAHRRLHPGLEPHPAPHALGDGDRVAARGAGRGTALRRRQPQPCVPRVGRAG